LNPQHGRAWIGVGVMAQRSGNLELALQAYSRSVSAEPSSLAYVLLARALQQSGRTANPKRRSNGRRRCRRISIRFGKLPTVCWCTNRGARGYRFPARQLRTSSQVLSDEESSEPVCPSNNSPQVFVIEEGISRMAKPTLLTVDDDPNVLKAIERDLRSHYGENYRVLRADSGDAGLKILRELRVRNDAVALLLADQRMPHMDGIGFLTEAKQIYPMPSARCSPLTPTPAPPSTPSMKSTLIIFS